MSIPRSRWMSRLLGACGVAASLLLSFSAPLAAHADSCASYAGTGETWACVPLPVTKCPGAKDIPEPLATDCLGGLCCITPSSAPVSPPPSLLTCIGTCTPGGCAKPKVAEGGGCGVGQSCCVAEACKGTCGTCNPTSETPQGTCLDGEVCCVLTSTITPTTTPSTPTAPPTPTSLNDLDPLKGADIPTVIGRVISTFLGLVGSIALLAFVYAGIVYMTAAAEPKRIQKAKDIMKNAFIGLVIIMFAYLITTYYFQILTKA